MAVIITRALGGIHHTHTHKKKKFLFLSILVEDLLNIAPKSERGKKKKWFPFGFRLTRSVAKRENPHGGEVFADGACARAGRLMKTTPTTTTRSVGGDQSPPHHHHQNQNETQQGEPFSKEERQFESKLASRRTCVFPVVPLLTVCLYNLRIFQIKSIFFVWNISIE